MATVTGSKVDRKTMLAVLRRPLFFAMVNFFFLNTIFAFLPYRLGDVLYTMGRVAIVAYGGWLVCRTDIGGLRQAAIAGVGVYFFDHVILKGGVFLLNYLFKPEGMGLVAFSGVVTSFVLFAPLAMLIGAAGGIFAKRQNARRSSSYSSGSDGFRRGQGERD
jgi:hypothetical protein